MTTAKAIEELERSQGEPVAWMWQHGETGACGFLENAPREDLERWERINAPRKIVSPLYAAPRAAPEGWATDPDTIPKAMIDACAQQIGREFGQSIGTDGYYKRIIAATLAAAPKGEGNG